jgi:putative membrane protein
MITTAAQVLAENGHWEPGGLWPIFPLLWLLLFGGLIFAFFRFGRGRGRWQPERSAEGVLAERYARGEISDDEYRERLTVLKDNRA